ncbi:MAG: hypothetical protein EOP84_37295 [Verrucomicrobiaceae bacterium]|nr:MAG: hypothetical protein EOP84_37295 [Verrucomicrobiaceae bacterium]
MDLQVIDKRPPLSAAIALAKAGHDALLPKWRDDMSAMSAEVARKYFGALTEDAVRDGVDACVNLLSIGLLRSALPSFGMVYAGKDEFRPSLLMLLLSDASRNGPVHAYGFLLRETAERTEVKRQVALAEWLFSNTSSGRIAKRDLEGFFGTDTPEAEIAIHQILSLACGIAKADPYAESAFMEEDGPPEMMTSELQVTRLPAKQLSDARKRYKELIEKIPSELHPALEFRGTSWFDRFILPKTRASKAVKQS